VKLQIRAGVRYTRDRPAEQDFKLIGDPMATCPECDAEIEVDEFDVDKGDQLSCPECGSNLEVVGMSPLELDVAPDDDEDEDDDDDDDLEDDDEDLDDEDGDDDEDADKDDSWDE
jgi:alpha-aminoadipate carrier protein LysW